MTPTRFREALQAYYAWTAVAFSAALGVIALVTQWSMTLRLKAPPTAWDPSLNAFFCFLPIAFLFEAFSHLQARAHIEALEDRIRRLEADEDAS